MDEVVRCAGPECNRPLMRLGTGRPPKYCGPNCRKAAQRARDRVAEVERQRVLKLAGAKSTAARSWRPLEEISHEAEDLAAAVLAYAAGGDRADLVGKLAEFREAAWQLEDLAMTYFDAAELAKQLEAAPGTVPEFRDTHRGEPAAARAVTKPARRPGSARRDLPLIDNPAMVPSPDADG
jgi:hypothetical protein